MVDEIGFVAADAGVVVFVVGEKQVPVFVAPGGDGFVVASNFEKSRFCAGHHASAFGVISAAAILIGVPDMRKPGRMSTDILVNFVDYIRGNAHVGIANKDEAFWC